MPLRARQTSCTKTLRHLRGEKTRHLLRFLMAILFLSCRNLPRLENQTTVPNPPTSSKLLRFYLCQRSVRTASPLPTTTRRMRCFQVRNYNKISVSTTKSAVDPAKQDGVVYRIPCECGKMYIGETGRPMQDRIKEHDRHIRLARIETSAVSEHAHYTGHKPL